MKAGPARAEKEERRAKSKERRWLLLWSEGDEQGPRTNEGRGSGGVKARMFPPISVRKRILERVRQSTAPAAAVGRSDTNHPSQCPWLTQQPTTERAEEGMDVELAIERDRRAHLLIRSRASEAL